MYSYESPHRKKQRRFECCNCAFIVLLVVIEFALATASLVAGMETDGKDWACFANSWDGYRAMIGWWTVWQCGGEKGGRLCEPWAAHVECKIHHNAFWFVMMASIACATILHVTALHCRKSRGESLALSVCLIVTNGFVVLLMLFACAAAGLLFYIAVARKPSGSPTPTLAFPLLLAQVVILGVAVLVRAISWAVECCAVDNQRELERLQIV